MWQNTPPLPPGIANPALSAAIARSHEATSWQPAAVASAWTLATTGWGISWIVFIIVVHTSNSSRASSSEASFMSPKSWPAENTGPLAARITPVRVALADLAERLGQLAHHVGGERVALLGPVEGDRDDVAVTGDVHVLSAHDPKRTIPAHG